MNALITVSFHQHAIVTTRQNGKVWVAIRPIAEALGLDRKAQQDRIKRDPVLSTCGVMMTLQLPGDTQSREVFFLDLDYLNGWLFGIDVNRVKPHLRETIITYQRECYAALAQHFRRQVSDEHIELSNRLSYAERAYFKRYPERTTIRRLALVGEPYWYIGHKVGRSAGTVGKAIRNMIEWGMMEARQLQTARQGMAAWWARRRQQVSQMTLGF